MNHSVLDLKTLIDGFKLTCQTEGKSKKTIEWYTAFLTRFQQFLETRQLPTDLTVLQKDHIKMFIRFLQTEAKNPGLSPIVIPAVMLVRVIIGDAPFLVPTEVRLSWLFMRPISRP